MTLKMKLPQNGIADLIIILYLYLGFS